MTTTPRGPRLGQLRNDPAVRTAIASAFDAVLAQHPERAAEARQAQHRADFEKVWATLDLPHDPALKRRTFAQLAPDFARWDAQDDLRRALGDDWKREHERRMAAASALGRAQGRVRAFREHFQAAAVQDRALAAALDEAAERARRRSLSPVGITRFPLRLP